MFIISAILWKKALALDWAKVAFNGNKLVCGVHNRLYSSDAIVFWNKVKKLDIFKMKPADQERTSGSYGQLEST